MIWMNSSCTRRLVQASGWHRLTLILIRSYTLICKRLADMPAADCQAGVAITILVEYGDHLQSLQLMLGKKQDAQKTAQPSGGAPLMLKFYIIPNGTTRTFNATNQLATQMLTQTVQPRCR